MRSSQRLYKIRVLVTCATLLFAALQVSAQPGIDEPHPIAPLIPDAGLPPFHLSQQAADTTDETVLVAWTSPQAAGLYDYAAPLNYRLFRRGTPLGPVITLTDAIDPPVLSTVVLALDSGFAILRVEGEETNSMLRLNTADLDGGPEIADLQLGDSVFSNVVAGWSPVVSGTSRDGYAILFNQVVDAKQTSVVIHLASDASLVMHRLRAPIARVEEGPASFRLALVLQDSTLVLVSSDGSIERRTDRLGYPYHLDRSGLLSMVTDDSLLVYDRPLAEEPVRRFYLGRIDSAGIANSFITRDSTGTLQFFYPHIELTGDRTATGMFSLELFRYSAEDLTSNQPPILVHRFEEENGPDLTGSYGQLITNVRLRRSLDHRSVVYTLLYNRKPLRQSTVQETIPASYTLSVDTVGRFYPGSDGAYIWRARVGVGAWRMYDSLSSSAHVIVTGGSGDTIVIDLDRPEVFQNRDERAPELIVFGSRTSVVYGIDPTTTESAICADDSGERCLLADRKVSMPEERPVDMESEQGGVRIDRRDLEHFTRSSFSSGVGNYLVTNRYDMVSGLFQGGSSTSTQVRMPQTAYRLYELDTLGQMRLRHSIDEGPLYINHFDQEYRIFSICEVAGAPERIALVSRTRDVRTPVASEGIGSTIHMLRRDANDSLVMTSEWRVPEVVERTDWYLLDTLTALAVQGDRLLHLTANDTLLEHQLIPAVGEWKSYLLGGNRILRGFLAHDDSGRYHLEVVSLLGNRRDSVIQDLQRFASPDSLQVVVSGNRIFLLSWGQSGILQISIFDELLRPIVEYATLADRRGEIAHVDAQIVGEDLHIVWEERTPEGISKLYGLTTTSTDLVSGIQSRTLHPMLLDLH